MRCDNVVNFAAEYKVRRTEPSATPVVRRSRESETSHFGCRQTRHEWPALGVGVPQLTYEVAISGRGGSGRFRRDSFGDRAGLVRCSITTPANDRTPRDGTDRVSGVVPGVFRSGI